MLPGWFKRCCFLDYPGARLIPSCFAAVSPLLPKETAVCRMVQFPRQLLVNLGKNLGVTLGLFRHFIATSFGNPFAASSPLRLEKSPQFRRYSRKTDAAGCCRFSSLFRRCSWKNSSFRMRRFSVLFHASSVL